MVRIATYNIWNSEEGMPQRENYIIDEIINCNADIVCLQEVHDKVQAEKIALKANYKYLFFDNYRCEAEGLCILSKKPFDKCSSWYENTNAMQVAFSYNNKTISVINLHLPWDSVIKRENQIVDIIDYIEREDADYVFLAGDFNCSDGSDVQRFLLGDCSLKDTEANPCWYDLALAYSNFAKMTVENTLNFRENPRFKNNTIEANSRFDRILLRNTYPNKFPALLKCEVFGKRVYEDIKLAASDHYGVVVEMEFNN